MTSPRQVIRNDLPNGLINIRWSDDSQDHNALTWEAHDIMNSLNPETITSSHKLSIQIDNSDGSSTIGYLPLKEGTSEEIRKGIEDLFGVNLNNCWSSYMGSDMNSELELDLETASESARDGIYVQPLYIVTDCY